MCNEIKDWFEFECGCKVLGIVESPIKGPKGNKNSCLQLNIKNNEDSDLQ